ncbi:hypothetical protein SSX86_021997 [Deinandra increscens subsp. villosa]|uniref:RING-type domain-containing protein n=1 Tax=Deinandra increscens subsp. villosa TaxID=3103831 RepID=A0AAP0CSG5_9ASTR
MGIQFLHHLAIKIPQTITTTILSLLISALSHLRLLKSPPHPHDPTSSSSAAANYILILDGPSPSLLPVPLHVITASIKTKLPVIPYSDFARRYGGARHAVCTVCLDCVDGCDLIREVVNCKHVFHRECLDGWVDVGQINCPLCRSMLLPPKKLVSSAAGDIVRNGQIPIALTSAEGASRVPRPHTYNF